MSADLQNRLAHLRFTSYIGAQLVALIIPLLIFTLTQSLTFAGIALVIEWLPKLAFYFCGGSLIARFGQWRSILTLNIARTASFMALALVCLNHGPVWVILLCAATYQCANALSNILFENLVTDYWATDQRASGHARLMKCDQLGCAVALIYGLITLQPLILIIGGLVSQLVTLGIILRCRAKLAAVTNIANSDGTLKQISQQLRQDIQAAGKTDLIGFAFTSMLLAVPFCCLFSVLAFYLERAQPGTADDAQFLALILLCKTILNAAALSCLQYRLHKHGRSNLISIVGMGVMVISAAIASQSYSLPVAIGLVLILSLGWIIYQPWMRNLRQELILQHVPASSRAGVTGILISVEAASYLVSGGLLILTYNRLDLALIVAAILACVGFVWRLLALSDASQHRQLVIAGK